ILDRQRMPAIAEVGKESGPPQSRRSFPRNADDLRDSFVEPHLQQATAPARRQKKNAEADFAENDRVDREVALIAAQPLQHCRVRLGLDTLAQYISVDEVRHDRAARCRSTRTRSERSSPS